MGAVFHVCARRLKQQKISLYLIIGFWVFLLLTCVLSGLDVSCWAQESGSRPSLLTLRYVDTDLTRNDVLYDSRLVLCSTGLFHLMRKTQIIGEDRATLKIYQGQLSEAQLAEVRLLLASKDLEALPPFDISSVMPFISKLNFAMEEAFVSIYRNNKVQEAGYVIWHGHRPEDSIEGAPADVQNEQYRAKALLASLVRWQSGLQGTLVDPNSQFLGCSV